MIENLNICYIVKNSIMSLPESYQVMRNLSENIVVIDTGSSDGTKEWADSRDDITLYDFKWCNSFSKARNFGINKCDKEWILMIDDDEYIPESYHKDIEKLLTNARASIYSFDCVNFLQDPKWFPQPLKLAGRINRLFRNNASLKYKNHVHEVLTGHPTPAAMPLNIPLFHFQFKAYYVMLEKMEFRRKLIAKDLEKREATFLDEVHLANTYRESFRWYAKEDDRLNAISHLQKALKIKDEKFIRNEIKSLEEAHGRQEIVN